MKNIPINLPENAYNVKIGSGIFSKILSEIKKLKLYSNLFVIVDFNVFKLYEKNLKSAFENHPGKIFFHKVKVSEKLKNFETVNALYSKLIDKNFGRDTLIIAVGGGIIGDIAGYTAATYMRGIPFIQVPTTLLSAVDSSVGGKTGINFGSTKNVVGAFHQPKLVLLDTEYFKTLPEEEIICGFGEIVKYSYLTEKKFFNYLCKNFFNLINLDSAVIQKVIDTCIKYKASVVIEDEKESGIRKLLNLGHTFAHAIEVEQDHKIKHGQAVVVGIACACYLSNRIGLIDDKVLENYLSLLIKFREYIKIDEFNTKALLSLMKRDKKNKNDEIKFVLPVDFGDTIIDITVNSDDASYALYNGIGLFN